MLIYWRCDVKLLLQHLRAFDNGEGRREEEKLPSPLFCGQGQNNEEWLTVQTSQGMARDTVSSVALVGEGYV